MNAIDTTASSTLSDREIMMRDMTLSIEKAIKERGEAQFVLEWNKMDLSWMYMKLCIKFA